MEEADQFSADQFSLAFFFSCGVFFFLFPFSCQPGVFYTSRTITDPTFSIFIMNLDFADLLFPEGWERRHIVYTWE